MSLLHWHQNIIRHIQLIQFSCTYWDFIMHVGFCSFNKKIYPLVILVWTPSPFQGCKQVNKDSVKGGFFSESAIRFFKSPNLQKKIFQKTILNLKFKISAHNIILLWAGILNFKSRIVFWNIFFGIFGDLKKRITLSEKKPPLEK